jgi:hypothetical protein
MPDAKRRFRGQAGAVFVPHPSISETTIKARVEAGDWTPIQPTEKKAPAKRAASPKKTDED